MTTTVTSLDFCLCTSIAQCTSYRTFNSSSCSIYLYSGDLPSCHSLRVLIKSSRVAAYSDAPLSFLVPWNSQDIAKCVCVANTRVISIIFHATSNEFELWCKSQWINVFLGPSRVSFWSHTVMFGRLILLDSRTSISRDICIKVI